MKNTDLTRLESEIIAAIYEHERPTEIVPTLSVVLREYSGNGVFITLQAKEDQFDVIKNETPGKKLHIVIPGLPHGCGALLYIEQGKPKLLEMYVNGYDEWPKVMDGYRIEYRS